MRERALKLHFDDVDTYILTYLKLISKLNEKRKAFVRVLKRLSKEDRFSPMKLKSAYARALSFASGLSPAEKYFRGNS